MSRVRERGVGNEASESTQDKKNQGSTVMFSLINGPGSCLFDVEVSDAQIADAINFYLDSGSHR